MFKDDPIVIYLSWTKLIYGYKLILFYRSKKNHFKKKFNGCSIYLKVNLISLSLVTRMTKKNYSLFDGFKKKDFDRDFVIFIGSFNLFNIYLKIFVLGILYSGVSDK